MHAFRLPATVAGTSPTPPLNRSRPPTAPHLPGVLCLAPHALPQFHAQPQCDINNGASVSATINGVPTRVGPAYDQPPDGPPGGTILRLTQLGLTAATANGARLCIKLTAGRNGTGCGTLEQMCVPPAGSPPGVCTAAIFDSGNGCE